MSECVTIREALSRSPAIIIMAVGRSTDPPSSAAVKVFSAGTAGCVADLFTFPLDTAKVRLQVRVTCTQISEHHQTHSDEVKLGFF